MSLRKPKLGLRCFWTLAFHLQIVLSEVRQVISSDSELHSCLKVTVWDVCSANKWLGNLMFYPLLQTLLVCMYVRLVLGAMAYALGSSFWVAAWMTQGHFAIAALVLALLPEVVTSSRGQLCPSENKPLMLNYREWKWELKYQKLQWTLAVILGEIYVVTVHSLCHTTDWKCGQRNLGERGGGPPGQSSSLLQLCPHMLILPH